MHKMLHLQHHSHTAKHLPHHHTSYRALLLLVVLMGSLLIWLNRASALDYEVSALVPAQLPPGSPVIETPDGDTIFSNSDQIEVTGSCIVVVPSLVVILLRDGEPIGSGVCQADGTFRIPITMVLGENVINVKYKTITGEDGPPGQTLILFYKPAVLPVVPPRSGGVVPGASTETPATAKPLTIKTVDFVPYALEEKLLMTAEIRGGTPPYRLKIDWGDGSVESFTIADEGVQNLAHIYKVSKATMTVIMEATDSTGQKTMVHLAAVFKAGRQLIQSPGSTEESNKSVIDRWMAKGLWAGYGGTLVALAAVWWHAKSLTATRAAYVVAPKRGVRVRGGRS